VAYVVTRLCRDCKDLSCVKVCPTSCILEHVPASGASDLPNQLFIDPDDCIDCNACVPECPWEAIYAEADVPPKLQPDVALNALVRERRGVSGTGGGGQQTTDCGGRGSEPDALGLGQ
jgi:ferredoxin